MPDSRTLEGCVFTAPCAVRRSFGGFGVFASEPLRAGTVLHLERPHALTPSWDARRTQCALCFRTAPRLEEWPIVCERCESVAYCSEACAGADVSAELHSECECAALDAWRRREGGGSDDAADLVVQAIRILSLRLRRRTTVAFPVSENDRRQPGLVVGYESYASRLCSIRRTAATAAILKRAAHAALDVLPPEAAVPPAELCDTLSRHQCNVFGVMGAAARSAGLASFVGAMQLMNHSCLPNAVFDCMPRGARGERPHFAMVALTDIAAGDEIVHCYASSADGPAQRLRYLREHHGFECTCARCACDDLEVEAQMADDLDAMRCCSDECSTGFGYVVPPPDGAADSGARRRCVQCGARWIDVDEDDDEP